MPQPNTPLGYYIDDLRQRQNLSWRKASYRCGLSPETLSMLVRRGATSIPRPSTLRAIADGLGANYGHMMILAGHLEAPDETEPPPEMKDMIARLMQNYNQIRHDPKAVQALTIAVDTVTESLRIVYESDKRAASIERGHDRKEPAPARMHTAHS